jgi:hypothetical protein
MFSIGAPLRNVRLKFEVRKMKKIMSCFLLFISITAAFMADAYALTPPRPEPRRIHLGDGRVFHLTPPEFEAQGYPKSGLYQDGELVYTFDRWELWGHMMFFSNDAMSFLVVPISAFGVIRFYERGVLTHYHGVQNLFRYRGEPCQCRGLYCAWINRDEIRLDRANDRLQIITLEGYKIMFDLSTGFILSQYISPEHVPEEPEEQQSGQISTIALVGGPLLISGVIVVLVKKFPHKK